MRDTLRLPALPGSPASIGRGLLRLLAAPLLALPLVSLGYASTKPDWLDGRDFELYLMATRRWLEGGHFYEPYQLAGPYLLQHGDVLYPPVGLVLFAPFTLLPALLWWAIPIGIVAWVVWQLRPNLLGLVLVALCVAWPATVIKISTGNPVLWIVAAVALGVRYGWPSVLVLVKPTLAPFAVIGIRRRSWWIALAAFAAVSLPFGAMWLDWLAAVRNLEGAGFYYSSAEIPTLALPILAELTRTRRREAAAVQPAAERDERDGSNPERRRAPDPVT